MFACITRTADKNLECHGFVCKSTEEAVSIAAQLYQALVDTVKAQGNDKKVCFTGLFRLMFKNFSSFLEFVIFLSIMN